MIFRTAVAPFAEPAPRTGRRLFLCAAVAAHVLALAAVVSCKSTPRPVKRPVLPFDVAIVTEAPPTPPPEPQPLPVPKAPPIPHAAPTPLPEIVIDAPAPPVVVAAAPAPALIAPPAEATASAPPAPAAPPAPPAPPPAPKRVSPDSVTYAVRPPEDFPPLSRRLNETGKVLLRVVFDVGGYPRVVALARSSGFTRLDEQAVSAMRRARIHPCKDNGVAVECELIAPMVYELED